MSWANAIRPSTSRPFYGKITETGAYVPQQQNNYQRSASVFTPLVRTLATFNDHRPDKNLVRSKMERLFPRVYEGERELNNWSNYIEAALREGVVINGKQGGEIWISMSRETRDNERR